MEFGDYYKETMSVLNEIKVSQGKTEEHLENLNGNVARHEEDLKGQVRMIEVCQEHKNKEIAGIKKGLKQTEIKIYMGIAALGGATSVISVLALAKRMGVW